jgi:hypothetical protein
MSSNLPLTYTINGIFFPAFPGAWLVSNNNPNDDATADNVSLPVYTSINDLNSISDPSYNVLGINDTIDDVIVLPKFKVVAWENGIGFGATQECDNTSGKGKKVFKLNASLQNILSSVELYFNNNLIKEPL